MKPFFEQVVYDLESSISTELVEDPAIGKVFHFHPEVELTYIERGHGWRLIGGGISEFQDGDLALLGSMLPHLYLSCLPGKKPHKQLMPKIKVIKFEPNFGMGKEAAQPEFSAIRRLIAEAGAAVVFDAEVARVAAPLIKKIFDARGIDRLLILLKLLDILAHGKYCKLEADPQIIPMGSDVRLNRILRFVGERFVRNKVPTQTEAAAFACLSVESFSRYFKQKTRKSYIEYVSELKIGKSLRLLRETDQSVSEIANVCGYDNLSNFNRHFKRLNHLTPREFRKLI